MSIELNPELKQELTEVVAAGVAQAVPTPPDYTPKFDELKDGIDQLNSTTSAMAGNTDGVEALLADFNVNLTAVLNKLTGKYNEQVFAEVVAGNSLTLSAVHSVSIVAIPNGSGVVNIGVTSNGVELSMYPGESINLTASETLTHNVVVSVTTGKARIIYIK